MLLIPLIIVGLGISGVMSRSSFDFRSNCVVNHMGTYFSAKCDGQSKYIRAKDILLDKLSTAHLSEMNLTNFQSVTLDSSVQVHKIIIKNTKNVSLYINNVQLKELIIESVDMLTIKHKISDSSITRKIDRMALLKVNTLQVINEEQDNFLVPINKVEISDVEDFGLESLQLHIVAEEVSITTAKIRFKGQSSLLVDASSANITKSLVYIHDRSNFTIKVDWGYIASSMIDLEDGVLQLESDNVIFSGNSLYGFETESLLISGNVTFEKNNIFTNDIVHFLSFKSRQIIFTENKFDCTVCGSKEKLSAMDLKDVGDTNYCYSDCKLSLNKYKEMLNNYCVCNNSEPTMMLPLLCAPCSLKSEITSKGIMILVNDTLLYVLFVALLLVFIISISCCVCYKNKLPFVPQQRACRQGDSEVVIYRKPQNGNDNDGYDSDNGYVPVGELR